MKPKSRKYLALRIFDLVVCGYEAGDYTALESVEEIKRLIAEVFPE